MVTTGAWAQQVPNLRGAEIRISAWWAAPDPSTVAGSITLERWRAVEQKYNCKIKWVEVPAGDTVSKLVASSMSGQAMADIVYLETNQALPILALKGLLRPLDTYFDFNDPRWPKNMKGVASFRGKMYGYFDKSDSTHGIWYNKTLFRKEGLPDLYELQQKGAWTWDVFFDIAKKATRDLDGDGKTDQWGIGMGYVIEDRLIFSNGGRVVEEKNGKIQFAANQPAAVEALEFVGKLWGQGLVKRNATADFISGRTAMFTSEAWAGESFKRNMKDEVGYVFYPMGPRMKEYTSLTDNTVIQAFPVASKMDPKVLSQIVMDLIPWSRLEELRLAQFESWLTSEEDVQTALRMADINQLNTMNAYSPSLPRAFWRTVDNIRNGKSAATAIAEQQGAAQAAIDSILAGK
jgi:ABC-type glycerol-3-phosphate transport system substrate-binding protein